jgi:opacity protein-like surface antigen
MRSTKSIACQAGTALLASALLMTSALAAEGPRYSYVQAGYVDLEIDNDSGFGGDLDGDGFAIGGSLAVTDMFHLFTDYTDIDLDADNIGVGADYSEFAIGGGINYAMSDTVDLVGRLAYLDAEVEVDTFGSADESGYGLYAGARAMVSPAWEVNGGIGYSDLGDGIDGTTFSLGTLYSLTDIFAVGAGVSFGDDTTSLQVGARLYFDDM